MRDLSKVAGAALLAVIVAVAFASPAAARRDYYGRDYRSFSPAERRAWGRGYWAHDWHDGRYAWWWVVGGSWYFYTEPVYPYPTYVPPAVVIQQAPPPVPAGPPPVQVWYYCASPQGYYPYVASCSVPWQPVPATPPR